MTMGGRLTRLARTRQQYTGEPFQVSRHALHGGDNQRPVTEATGDQAHLEAEVLAKLGTGGQWWSHPLGIAHVRPAFQSALIQLDSHTRFRRGTPYPRTAHALDRLLPSAEPGVQVTGVIGLRVASIEGVDLHLSLSGTTSRVILRGVPGTRWDELLDERWHRWKEAGCPPLWRSPSLTDHEEADILGHPETWKDERDLDWIGSALLRRVALFHTWSSAYSTRSWITGDEWIFELDTVLGVPLGHDVFLERLLDPVWGLPLRVDRHHCSCAERRDPDEGVHLRQCTYHLRYIGLPRGGLQLRFRHGHAVYASTDLRAVLESVGSPVKWLDRVLPASSSGLWGATRRHRPSRRLETGSR
ncbi:hypothetical protein AB0F30_25160 [Streptomyces sp. NPDC029006]|uniref:hypothetical protein n=1 Tax=Streptomyces sp. NPDC029006 TaxID=3155467 RepID=UPI0033F65980